MIKILIFLPILLIILFPGRLYALTSSQLFSIENGSVYYQGGASSAPQGCSTISSPTTPSSSKVNTTSNQQTIIQDIIGIAKTDNLGQQGALIGLMVSRDESSFTNLANTNVPLSLQNPNQQGIPGNNGTSLGVFQQQITKGWSTISSSISSTAAINQLMTPTYSAEAFFGSPTGTNTSSALTKGLMDVSGWQSMQPWVAAQTVQRSGTASGSNYEAQQPIAQGLLNQYWSTSPPIPLPVPFQSVANNSSSGSLSVNGTGCSATGSTLASTSYLNPFRNISNLIGQRVDQGVDFDGTGPVYAIGDGTVLNTANSGWPAGNFIVYKLANGPAKGLELYIAEDCSPSVSVGQNVTTHTVICNMYQGKSGIETGWAATNNGSSEAFALGQAALGISQKNAGKYSTGMGVNFLNLLQSLGLKLSGGTNTINQPIQNQNMPAGFPVW